MRKHKMNMYELQSYFKSLCRSFYIAYDQAKRLEKQRESLEIKNQLNDEEQQELKELKEIIHNWLYYKWKCFDSIVDFIKKATMCEEEGKIDKFSIIITTKEEIYALICFYSSIMYCVEDYQIVNMEEEHRNAFSSKEKVYEDFFKAYEYDLLHAHEKIANMEITEMEKLNFTYLL